MACTTVPAKIEKERERERRGEGQEALYLYVREPPSTATANKQLVVTHFCQHIYSEHGSSEHVAVCPDFLKALGLCVLSRMYVRL